MQYFLLIYIYNYIETISTLYNDKSKYILSKKIVA